MHMGYIQLTPWIYLGATAIEAELFSHGSEQKQWIKT